MEIVEISDEYKELNKVLNHIIRNNANVPITTGEALHIFHKIIDNTSYQDFNSQSLLKSCKAYWIVDNFEKCKITEDEYLDKLCDLNDEV